MSLRSGWGTRFHRKQLFRVYITVYPEQYYQHSRDQATFALGQRTSIRKHQLLGHISV